MTNKALCVGINDYPGVGNDLGGCVNDANDWAELLTTTYGFPEGNITMLLDSQATKQAITGKLKSLLTGAESGDVVVFTFSGHGTWRPDESGDESDGRDEALCAHDGIIIDDDIRQIIKNMGEGVHFTFISDSCHSGSVTKQMLERAGEYRVNTTDEEYVPKPRFMPPDVAAEIFGYELRSIPFSSFFANLFSVFSSFLSLFKEGPEILLSGCKDDEYSFDAFIDSRRNGAFSAIAIRIMKENPSTSYDEFYTELRKYLPSVSYQQSPQIRGGLEARRRKLFT